MLLTDCSSIMPISILISSFSFFRPERGSFPLDHEGECKSFMVKYLACLKQSRGMNDDDCRNLSKQYLDCRMQRYDIALPPQNSLHFLCPFLSRTDNLGEGEGLGFSPPYWNISSILLLFPHLHYLPCQIETSWLQIRFEIWALPTSKLVMKPVDRVLAKAEELKGQRNRQQPRPQRRQKHHQHQVHQPIPLRAHEEQRTGSIWLILSIPPLRANLAKGVAEFMLEDLYWRGAISCLTREVGDLLIYHTLSVSVY